VTGETPIVDVQSVRRQTTVSDAGGRTNEGRLQVDGLNVGAALNGGGVSTYTADISTGGVGGPIKKDQLWLLLHDPQSGAVADDPEHLPEPQCRRPDEVPLRTRSLEDGAGHLRRAPSSRRLSRRRLGHRADGRADQSVVPFGSGVRHSCDGLRVVRRARRTCSSA
jgi:hypothetical protein